MPTAKKSRVRVSDPDRLNYTKKLGERVRVARTGADLEPDAVAAKLGVPANTYLKWERGERQFPMQFVYDFCKLTGFSPSFIVTGRPSSEWGIGPETGKFRRPKFKRDPQWADDDDNES